MNCGRDKAGRGVRRLSLEDQAPACEIAINRSCYDLSEVCRGRRVIDIGCGSGRFRGVVESAGGTWIGVEPFEGGGRSIGADAQALPFGGGVFDVAIMHAVLEHIPDVSSAFAECSRVLRPGGALVGYVAFMECFHEISYSHLSFKALEHYAAMHGMRLKRITGGHRFGLDYHFQVFWHPIPVRWLRPILAVAIRGWIRLKSSFSFLYLRIRRGMPVAEARDRARLWYQVECLRLSQGFNFLIRRL